MKDGVTLKLIIIAVVGGACTIASFLVFGLVSEREHRYSEVKKEIAESWGQRQTIVGPMIVAEQKLPAQNDITPVSTFRYLLPETVSYTTELVPEVRSRGIFDTVVYSSRVKISGTFSAREIEKISGSNRTAVFSVGITDTRGIEKQINLTWDKALHPFSPSSKNVLLRGSGIHTEVPVRADVALVPFEFEVQLRGSEGIVFAPVGKETNISITSSWTAPKFTGAFLPSARTVSNAGFEATWSISSFGQSYPQAWSDFEVDAAEFSTSATGVDLIQGVDIYDQLYRSIKYAILFILVTFATFFVFEILVGLRIHPVQYLLVGASLALFYLLLLSFAEHIGFLASYIISTTLIALLVTAYSARVLESRRRAFPIFALLVVLYGYLYFVLQLEDYALLFGALLLFIILAGVMYLTRNVNWFEPRVK